MCRLQSALRKFLYPALSSFAKRWFGHRIVGKKIAGTSKVLYYEAAQHLTFLGRRQIHYEPALRQAISPHVREGQLVFDLGANIGQYTLWLSEKVGNCGRVVAVEPGSKNFAFLQFNVAINRCENAICERCAVGAVDAEMELYIDTETGGRRSSLWPVHLGEAWRGPSEKVAVRTLDGLIKRYGVPAFVKIDVEGAEADIFRRCSALPPHCTFAVEVRSETKEEVFRFFAERQYACYCVEKGNSLVLRAEDIPPFAHLLFSKREGAAPAIFGHV